MVSSDAMKIDDWELLAAATVEDPSPFTTLVKRHYRASVAYCAHVVGDHHRAEDIVQRGFVRVFEARDRVEPRARFRTYLFRVLVNLCLNERERRSDPIALSHVSDRADEVVPDDAAPGPSARLEETEAREMIAEAMMHLPARHRAALYLREYDGLGYSEIAVSLEATLAEVKIWIHRARRRLEAILRPYLDRGERVP